jgi:hypothetical protein
LLLEYITVNRLPGKAVADVPIIIVFLIPIKLFELSKLYFLFNLKYFLVSVELKDIVIKEIILNDIMAIAFINLNFKTKRAGCPL